MTFRKIWTEEEDKAFLILVQRFGQKNWAEIARLMAVEYGFKSRSGKQCRERWHNHLDPSICKKTWSKSQEEKMFELHKKYGNKWTIVAENMPGRTDNAIKNYFYSTIRRSLRRMGKFVGEKNSTSRMKQIKPSTLTKIFSVGHEQQNDEIPIQEEQKKLLIYIKQHSQSVRDQIVLFANYKPKKKDKKQQQQKYRFGKVIAKMIEINDIYEKIRYKQKRKRMQQLMFQKDYMKIVLSEQSDSDQSSLSNEQDESDKSELSKFKQISTRTRKDIKIPQKNYPQNFAKIKVNEITREEEKNIQNAVFAKRQSHIVQPTILINTIADTPKNENEIDCLFDEKNEFENPEFYFELQDEVLPIQHNHNSTLANPHSPGFFFNTPSLGITSSLANPNFNNFNFFQSPNTPKQTEQYSNLLHINGLQNSAIEQFKNNLRKQIESNTSNQSQTQKKIISSLSTINSPRSAFKFYS